jgi:protein TonB
LSFATENNAERRAEMLRWGICFALVLVIHGAAAGALLAVPKEEPDFADAAVPVMMELPQIAAPMPVQGDDSAQLGPLDLSDPTPPPPEEQTKPPPEEVAELALPIPEPPKPQLEQEQRTAPHTVEAPPVSEAAPPNTRRWQALLAAHINNFKHYPPEARAHGEEGMTRVAFSIDHEGRLLSSRIVQSSGSPTLDQEALAMLARAQPMPRPPDGLTESELSFDVPVRFSLR